ncbi:MAG: amidohydrolase/deacetylase family metallohydrolase [Bacteroidota bacterium]
MKALLHFCLFILSLATFAQPYDLMLKGGHVIDPKNGIDEVRDVAIANGKIASVERNIPAQQAKQVVDVAGMYVTPGLIDMHSHNFFGTIPFSYLSNSFSAPPPDGFTFRTGVTTVVDAGGAGWRNFRKFKEQTVDNSKTRVYAFLNIVGSGMKGGAIEQNLGDMDAKLTATVAKQFPDLIVGIKLAHYAGPEWTPTERAVEAGRLAGIPVMIDFGGNPDLLSIEKLFMEELRPGDIFTHCYAHVNGREPIVDENGQLKPFVLEARDRGIVFDVGHGGGSFLYDQAVPAVAQGLKPTTISTDFHTGSMNAGMKDMTNVMSKFLDLDMTIQEVVYASTWKPAQVIQKEQLGHLSVDAIADVTVLRIEEGEFGFVDTKGWKRTGTQKLVAELTIKDGGVVWDLNGISRPEWSE